MKIALKKRLNKLSPKQRGNSMNIKTPESQEIEKMEGFDDVDELKVVDNKGVLCLMDMNDYPDHD